MIKENKKMHISIVVICLLFVAVLLLSETVFAGHHCLDDEHCMLCILSSVEKFALVRSVCAFVVFSLSVSLNLAKITVTGNASPVARKVKLND